MELDKDFSDFKKVQPLCAKIARDCCLEDIAQLENILKTLNSSFINKFQEYLLFPFRLFLLRKQNEKVTIKSIDMITYIFERSSLQSWPVFSSTLMNILNLISFPDDINEVSKGSEELKSSVCLCIASLVQSSSKEVCQKIYEDSFNLPLAQVFHTLIGLLRHERCKYLRKTILRTIALLCYNRQFITSKFDEIEEYASSALASYLPGLSITLASVVCGDNKQGESVIRMALSVLADLLVLVVGDQSPVSTVESRKKDSGVNENNVSVIKNEKWFQEVAIKLQILIKNTTVLVNYDHWKVRLEYLNFSELILCNCTRNLENCVPVLLSAVFALSVDSHQQISQSGQKLIHKFSQKFQASNSASLCSLIEDHIYDSTSKLIQSKLSANDDQKLFILKSVQGYIQILGNSVDKLLFSIPHLEKLVLSLLNLLEFDTSMLMVVEEIGVNVDITLTPNFHPKKRFCYFQKEEILFTISSICHCLGQTNHSRLLVDYLIEKMHTSEFFVLQSIFIIGCLVEGLSKDSSCIEENEELVGDIIDELLCSMSEAPSQKTGDGTLHVYSEQYTASNNETYSGSKLYQICLTLETVEKCAETLGKRFRGFLMKVLFYIMEKAGSSNYILSQSGKLCLISIAQSCEYKPRVELIRENADYLVNSITINFHHFLYRPEMSTVLQVVLQESDGDMLSLFKDCICHLLSILDYNQENALLLLTVLKSVALYIKKWFPPKTSFSAIPVKFESDDLKTFFLKRNAERESLLQDCTSEDTDEVCVETNEVNNDSFQESEKQNLPLHVTLVSEILKRCSHLQSSKNLQLRVLALEVMEFCIIALGDFKTQQHPLIHELWKPFVQRFNEGNIVILQAFKVLLVIADECRDFVRVRCLKEIVPKLIMLLKSSFSFSLSKHYNKSYKWSNDCKLQLCILSKIGNLFCKLDVAEKDIALLVEVCLPYLQKTQPRDFQEAAFQTLKALTEIDPDAIWLYFNEMYSEQKTWIPPHESLQVIHFPHTSTTDSDFKFNT